MGHDCDNDGRPGMHPSVLQVIVGAIVVALLIMLFIWLLPIIGFVVVIGLVVLLIVAAVMGVLWLINGLRRGFGIGGGRNANSTRKTKSFTSEE